MPSVLNFATLAATLAKLGVPPAVPLAVAVSGGPDSLALLLLAAEVRPGLIRALTVDHRLRPTSAAEAEAVAQVCAGRGVPHATLVWHEPRPGQAAARAARYALMADWCAEHGVAWLATAHHADDQAETLLMRLARGSGTGGLAGIRAVRPLGRGVTLVRPLLAHSKADLAAIVVAAGVTAADDPSNRDPAYDRTRFRAFIAGLPPQLASQLATFSENLQNRMQDAENALIWATCRAWDGRVTKNGDALLIDAEDLPQELRFRLLARGLAAFGGPSPSGPALARLLKTLDSRHSATLAGVHAAPGPPWRLRLEPPRS